MLRRLRCIACLLLLPLVGGAALNAQEVTRPTMPAMRVALNADAYPGSAIRQGQQGRVLIEFSINKRGRVDNQVILHAEPVGVFDNAALGTLREIRFTVPDDWTETGGPEQRYRISVLFKLNPCLSEECTPPKAHPEADDFLIIGALRK